jgi:heat shock protein HtpX
MQGWNTIKTTLLLGALTGLFMLIGSALGGTGGMMIAFVFAIVMNMGAWWFSDKLALSMSRAQEVSPEEAPELHRMVERLSANANIPKPRVYIMDTPMPNAFATGRDPQHGAVAVTTGIMQLLNRDELAGVMAHELAHIKNRDTLISSIAATIAGAITMIADMAMWAAIFGGFGGGDDEEEGAGGLVGGLFMLILAPIAALLIQMAISRSREFSADEGGAKILGDPLPLASALQKLETYVHSGMPMTQVNPATSHLYIVNPTLGGLANLFRTHPPTHERVARLEALAEQGDRRVMA